MSTWTKTPNFGHKGVDDQAQSLAESLLTGKPVVRADARARGVDRTPKFKPRAKPRFGRKDVSESFACAVDRMVRRQGQALRGHGWKFWASTLVALMLALQALAGLFDWPSPTLGGRQLWTDVRVAGGWRVQCHAWTGHCRLLDTHDIRRTWGGETPVLAALDQAIDAGRVLAPNAHAVVLVHGLGRSAHSFDALAEALDMRGYEVVRFNYASTQGPIAEHARALNRVVARLQGTRRVSFVTHSLGGVVLRQALALKPAWRSALEQGPSVLLAAPNQGSAVARTLADFAPARALFGPALSELADAGAIKRLPSPTPFATVAGTHNPLWFFAGDSDGLVSVEESRLAGEAERLEVEAAHTFIMDDPRVIGFVTGFIAGQK